MRRQPWHAFCRTAGIVIQIARPYRLGRSRVEQQHGRGAVGRFGYWLSSNRFCSHARIPENVGGPVAKQIVSAEELVGLIAQEMEKHKECAGTVRPEVFWHEEHEGCNWDVDILGDSNTEAERCDDCIDTAVQALRAKYNLAKVDQ